MCPPRLPSSTAKLWERPTDTPTSAPLLHPTPPLLTQTQRGERGEPFICGFTLPTGHFASLSLSFHLSEMRVFFFSLPTYLAGWQEANEVTGPGEGPGEPDRPDAFRGGDLLSSLFKWKLCHPAPHHTHIHKHTDSGET